MSKKNEFKTKEEKTYPLDEKDIKQFPKEKIVDARIGSELDNYFMYAIKNNRLDTLTFLLEKCTEIPIDEKNSLGNTVFHLAVKTGNP